MFNNRSIKKEYTKTAGQDRINPTNKTSQMTAETKGAFNGWLMSSKFNTGVWLLW